MPPEREKGGLIKRAAKDHQLVALSLPAVTHARGDETRTLVKRPAAQALRAVGRVGEGCFQIGDQPLAGLEALDGVQRNRAQPPIAQRLLDGEVENMGDVGAGEQADKACKATLVIEGEQLALPVKAGQQRFKGTALIGGKGAFVQPLHAGKIRVSPAEGQGGQGFTHAPSPLSSPSRHKSALSAQPSCGTRPCLSRYS